MHTFYAVIHARDTYHGIIQAEAALDAGAHGVALIDQFCDESEVCEIAQALKHRPVLVNLLRNQARALSISAHLGCGVWADSFDPDSQDLRAALSIGSAIFGGVGFKYQAESDLQAGWRLRSSLDLARLGAFSAMTSGPRTGQAPNLRKIQGFRAMLGPDARLAIASGISAANIHEFKPYASHFFVGSSIETVDHDVIPGRVRELADMLA